MCWFTDIVDTVNHRIRTGVDQIRSGNMRWILQPFSAQIMAFWIPGKATTFFTFLGEKSKIIFSVA